MCPNENHPIFKCNSEYQAISDWTAKICNSLFCNIWSKIGTGKIDIYKQFKFLLKYALWHDFLVHFSFCLKVCVF